MRCLGLIQAILFDKDGTLVDFQRTWGPAVHEVMLRLASGRRAVYERLAVVSGFVQAGMTLQPDSLLVAQPTSVWGPLWAKELGCIADATFLAALDQQMCEATIAHLTPIGDPGTFVNDLVRRGYRVGVFSNDAEIAVRAHAGKLGIEKVLDFIAGYDSGFGSKPSADPVLAFARTVNVPPSQIAVVGDTALDLATAQAAGSVAVGVLTGPAHVEALASNADIILSSAAELVTALADP
jgi:phosphoglycolate phosphatase